MSFQNIDITRILENFRQNKTEVCVSPLPDAVAAPPPPAARPKVCCHEECKKKLLLTDFACKCEKIYCSLHRTPELHACNFDFKKAHGSDLMKKYGTPILTKKLDTI
jgi:AN1-like Zinc finger